MSCRLLHTLKPSTQGRLSAASRIPLTSAAFLRLTPKVSMQTARMFSNTASTVEKLAKIMNRKNSVPHSRPPFMLTNTCGSVSKMSEAP